MPNGWGKKLKHIVDEENIDLRRLSQEAKLTQKTIYTILSGKRKPTTSTKIKIIKALNKITKHKYKREEVFSEDDH